MEILLIRHTTPNIEKGICYGQSDIDITDGFTEEVSNIKKKIPSSFLDVNVYSSPLIRCRKLAEALFSEINFDNRLKELNFGDWELKKWNNIDKNELDIWMNDFVNIPTKNGESYKNLHQRTTQFLQELQHQNIKKCIIITHAGVIRSLCAFANGISLDKSFELSVSYGEIINLTIHNEKF